MHGFLGVGVSQTLHQFAHRDLNAQFFPQLPDQAFLKRLIRLAFAPGELPQATEMRLGVALRNQELAATKDQTGSDIEDGCRRGVNASMS